MLIYSLLEQTDQRHWSTVRVRNQDNSYIYQNDILWHQNTHFKHLKLRHHFKILKSFSTNMAQTPSFTLHKLAYFSSRSKLEFVFHFGRIPEHTAVRRRPVTGRRPPVEVCGRLRPPRTRRWTPRGRRWSEGRGCGRGLGTARLRKARRASTLRRGPGTSTWGGPCVRCVQVEPPHRNTSCWDDRGTFDLTEDQRDVYRGSTWTRWKQEAPRTRGKKKFNSASS